MRVTCTAGEALRICLLRLCVDLIKAAKNSIAGNRPLRDVLIKFAWRHLKVPDESPCRHWAFLATVHLLPLSAPSRSSHQGEQQQQLAREQSARVDSDTGQAPAASAVVPARERQASRPSGDARMVAQVWVSLLRVTQMEPRKGLMREILDSLVPTLVDKLGTRGEDGKVIWVR